jgi:uncharacterized membrane protein
MMGPALLCWAAAIGWLDFHHSGLAFLSTRSALVIFSLIAIGEMVLDKAPGIPPRVSSGGLFVRFASGAFCGVALATHCHEPMVFALLFGAFGSLLGAGTGYWVRKAITRIFHLSNLPAGLLEDSLAVLAGILFLWNR